MYKIKNHHVFKYQMWFLNYFSLYFLNITVYDITYNIYIYNL